MPETNRRESSFGASYARVGPRMDARGATEHRRRLVEAAHGAVIEIGAGYGATFPFYPSAVSRVLALEPDPTLRGLALAAASTAPVPVSVKDGVAEVVRVLRPGGLLLFYEHVRSAHRVLAAAEDLVTPLWSRAAGGCHPNRDTAATIAAANLTVQRLERFGFSVLPGNPRLAHVLGAASKP